MKKIFFLLTTTLLMVACQESNFDVVAPEGLTPGDVYASLDVSTKTSLGEGNVVNWVTNDSISVFAANTYNYRYKLKDGNGTISGKFEYDGYTGTGSDIANHYAVYPYSKDNNVDADGKLTVTFPSEFNAENGVAKAVMVSKSPTANNFAFKNVQGLIRLRLTAAENLPPTFNKVKKVQVTSATKKLAGAATVTFDNDGTPTVALPALEQNKPDTLTIDFGEGITLSSTDKDVYFPLAAGDYTDIELIFTMDGNKISKFSSISFTQAISKIYTLSHKFVMDDVDASTQGYETVAPTAEKAAELLETENSVEVSKMEANETLTIPAVKAGEEVNIKIDQVEGDGPVKIQASNDENKAPETLTVEAPANAKVIVDCPATHVELIGTNVTYAEVTASTSDNTLVVGEGVTVTSLVVKKGNVEVQGTVTTVTRNGENQDATTKVFLNGGSLTNTPASPIEVLNKDFKIGDKYYYSLTDAIAEVGSGQTITVVNNVTNAHGISVPSGKNFTVDFKNHKYAMQCPGAGSEGTKTIGFQLLEGSTIVFTNGTIECTEANKNATWTSDSKSKGIAMMIQNYANLTLENMTIDATNIAHNGAAVRYALSNNCGTVEYSGKTSITTLSGDYAFDVCKYANYNAPTVTWNSEGTVTGGIELSGGEFVVAQNLAVTAPITAIDDEDVDSVVSTLTVNQDATISTASSFKDPNPGISGPNVTGLVQVRRGADLTINGKGSILAGSETYAAVAVTVNGDNDKKTAKLTVDGTVTIQGDYYGIVGNGSRHNTEITIKGGTIKGAHENDNFGIYQPQNGQLTISGGTITAYSSAVEVRSGSVTISGGKLISTATSYSCNANGNGTTTVGAALAIAQHNTKRDISVTITNGTFEGVKAINESNPQANDPAPQVTMSVSGGTFNGEISTVDVTGFIHGGTFSNQPSAGYIGDDMVWEKFASGKYSYSGKLGTVNATHKLLKDASNGRISIGSIGSKNMNVILDLGGHTLSLSGASTYAGIFCNANIGTGNVITIKNGTIDFSNGKVAIQVTKGSTFNLESDLTIKSTVGGALVAGTGVLNCAATINNTGTDAAIQTNGNESLQSTINITGGQITSGGVGIYHPAGTLNISGDAKITGSTAVYVKSGTTTISGGTLTGNGEKKDYVFNGNGCNSTGDAFVVDNCGYTGGVPSVSITAGSFTSTNASAFGSYKNGDNSRITGFVASSIKGTEAVSEVVASSDDVYKNN